MYVLQLFVVFFLLLKGSSSKNIQVVDVGLLLVDTIFDQYHTDKSIREFVFQIKIVVL